MAASQCSWPFMAPPEIAQCDQQNYTVNAADQRRKGFSQPFGVSLFRHAFWVGGLLLVLDDFCRYGLRPQSALLVLSWPCFISTASQFVDENILPVLHSTEYVQRDGKHFGLASVIRDSGNFSVQFGSLDNFTWNKRRTTESSNLMRLI